MLSPDYISNLPEQIVKYWQEVEDYIINDICRRFRKMGEITGTAEIQRLVTQNLGADLTDIDNKIAEALHKSREEITQLFEEAAAKNQSDYNWMSEKTGRPLDKSVISQITQAAINTAQDDFDNITGTTGYITRSGQFSLWDQAYRQALSFGSLQVASGATSYTQAAREIINQFAGKGMMIQYPSGQRRTLETAVRLCITSGVGRMAKDMAEQNGQLLGADGVEISAHMDSAPDHEPYQGRQYTREAFEALDASLGRPFEIWNCRHKVYPVILGITPPVYTEEELREMAAKNAKGITYEGKHYTMYEASQMQRQIERKIRALKRELIGANAAHDQELFMNRAIKLRTLRTKYVEFSKAAGLPLQHERSQVYGYTRSMSAKVLAAEREYKLRLIQQGEYNATEGNKYKELTGEAFEKLTKIQDITAEEGRILWNSQYGYIQSTNYRNINDAMRDGTVKNLPKESQKTVKTLKAVTNRNRLDDNYLGVRYVDIELLQDTLGIDVSSFDRTSSASAEKIVNAINSTAVGKSITNKASTSISMVKEHSYFKNRRPVEIVVQMPKDSKGLITDNMYESEFISAPGSRLEVLGAKVGSYRQGALARVIIYVQLKN